MNDKKLDKQGSVIVNAMLVILWFAIGVAILSMAAIVAAASYRAVLWIIGL